MDGRSKFCADGLNFCGILGGEEFLDEFDDEIVFVQGERPRGVFAAVGRMPDDGRRKASGKPGRAGAKENP